MSRLYVRGVNQSLEVVASASLDVLANNRNAERVSMPMNIVRTAHDVRMPVTNMETVT